MGSVFVTILDKTRENYGYSVTSGVAGPLRSDLARAFSAVAREDFLPPPPWLAGGGAFGSMHRTSDPGDLYRNVLVAIDPARRINNGQPSLWAEMLALIGQPGKVRMVLHSGCGLGYYTAIMAHYFSGAIIEFDEAERDLCEQAAINLSGFANVRARLDTSRHDAIFLSYGICRIPAGLIAQMSEGCRLVAPVTDRFGRGQIVLFTREGSHLLAEPEMPVAFITDSTESSFPHRIRPCPAKIDICEGGGEDVDLAAVFAD